MSYIVPGRDALAALHHDDTEAYIADVIRPVKRNLGAGNVYFDLEKSIWRNAIAPAFGLDEELPESVKIADAYRVIALEKNLLHPRSDAWDLKGHLAPEGVAIRCLSPERAQRLYLRRHCELAGIGSAPLLGEMEHLMHQDDMALGGWTVLPRDRKFSEEG